MRIVTSTMAAALVCLVVLTQAPAARADILDDILSTANQASNRAGNARDRAIEARDAAQESRDRFRDGAAYVTGELQTMLDEAVADLQRTIQEELNIPGREEFLADGGCSVAVCEVFRADLITFIYNVESIFNSTLETLEVGGVSIDLQPLADQVQTLPGRVLFPLYRMLVIQTNLLAELNSRLPQVTTDLYVFWEAQNEQMGSWGEGSDIVAEELRQCNFMLEHRRLMNGALTGVSTMGSLLKIAGKALMAVGETEFEGTVGAVGIVQGTIQTDVPGTIGQFLDGISDTLSRIAANTKTKYRYCVTLEAIEN